MGTGAKKKAIESCDEEERVREGFEIDTFYRFAPGPDGNPIQQVAVAASNDGHKLLRLTLAPQSDLWRVNQKLETLRSHRVHARREDGWSGRGLAPYSGGSA